MKIAIFGTGYVGLVTGTCLSDVGHYVTCVDTDIEKLKDLSEGKVSLYEPGLEELVKTNIYAERLSFTENAQKAVIENDVIFIAVGTPMSEDGSANTEYVINVASSIGKYINNEKIIICKSTVPIGTTELVKETIKHEIKYRSASQNFHVASNPEFLKEGDAVKDFMRPDRIIIGIENDEVKKIMDKLYAPFNRNHQKIIYMDIRSSELTKYAANAMLATKISFINEMANISKKMGADIEKVRIGIGSDPRIGYDFIYPGCGFGGSCFPKDISALRHLAEKNGYRSELLEAVENINIRQKKVLFEDIENHFSGRLKNKKFALWGLSFKPKTDDMRDAPSKIIINALIKSNAKVQAFDPKANNEAKKIYQHEKHIKICETKEEAIKGADALVICTEWQNFKALNYSTISSLLKNNVIFDGRNMFDPSELQAQGFIYYSIGRPTEKRGKTK